MTSVKCDYEKAWKELEEEYGRIIFKRRSEKDSIIMSEAIK